MDMKAMVLERIGPMSPDSDPLVARRWPIPSPGPEEVLIRVQACAVCHTELDEIEGRVEARVPVIPGHQIVGEVAKLGAEVESPAIGTRVGVGWIFSACGRCDYCLNDLENLCPQFHGTGCHTHGGYAEWMCAPARFVHPVPDKLSSISAAPLLCGGAIGLRSLRLASLDNGQVLGLTGFGGSNHQVLRLARALYPDSEVMVWARDANQREQALATGAAWAGPTEAAPPAAPMAIIDTTPVWTTVLKALEFLAPGGRLVVNAISKEDSDRDALATLDYARQLWREKSIRSVANVTRRDISDMLALAARHGLLPETRSMPLTKANEALRQLRFGPIRGATVLEVREF